MFSHRELLEYLIILQFETSPMTLLICTLRPENFRTIVQHESWCRFLVTSIAMHRATSPAALLVLMIHLAHTDHVRMHQAGRLRKDQIDSCLSAICALALDIRQHQCMLLSESSFSEADQLQRVALGGQDNLIMAGDALGRGSSSHQQSDLSCI